MTGFDDTAQLLQGVELSSMQWSRVSHCVATTRYCAGFHEICDRLGIRKREVRTLPGVRAESIPEYTAETATMLIRHVCFPHLRCGQPRTEDQPQGDQVGDDA